MIIEAIDICKSYGDSQILNHVSVSVSSGESISISAPSGQGKSTLISIIGLLLQPSSGQVILDGENISALPDCEKARIRNQMFGFVFQYSQLIGSLSVLENVMIPALLAKDSGKQAYAKALLEQFGLADRMHYYPHQLSLGQLRRASLARAVLMNPPFLFADEPTNDLDQKNADEVARFLLEYPTQDKALVLVTHDAELAAKTQFHYQINTSGALCQI